MGEIKDLIGCKYKYIYIYEIIKGFSVSADITRSNGWKEKLNKFHEKYGTRF